MERREQQNIAGNIYKGIVKDVLPGMGAAFIEIGLEIKSAFLHYSDIVMDFLIFMKMPYRGRSNLLWRTPLKIDKL